MSRRWLRRAALLIVLALTFSRPTSAFSGGPGTGGRQIRLEDAPAGPYLLRVVSSPTPPRVENLYLEVRVTEASSGRVITDATVMTTATSVEGEAPPLEVEAVHAIAPIPTEYASHLPVSKAGVWKVTITVEGAPGRGEASLLIQILEQTSISAVVSIGLPVAGLAALAVVFYFLQRKQTRSTGEAQE